MTRLTFTALVLGILLLLVAVLPLPSLAATAVQVEFMANGVHNRDGNLLSGGAVWTYSGGTNLPKATYLDRAATTPASNPIVLDGEGKANVYAAGLYKFVVKDSTGAIIRIMDNFSYQDSSAALTSALTVSTTTDPQLTITNGSYSTTLGVSSVGETVLKPPSSFSIENATPQFILDNTSKQVTFGLNATSGNVTVNPGIEINNGVYSAIITPVTGAGVGDALQIYPELRILDPDGSYSVVHSEAGRLNVYSSDSTGVTTNSGLNVLGILDVSNGAIISGTTRVSDFRPPETNCATALVVNSNAVWDEERDWSRMVYDDAGKHGFVVMGGKLKTEAGAIGSATVNVGTLDANHIPAETAVVDVFATDSTAVTFNARVQFATSGVVSLVYLGTRVAAENDYFNLHGVIYRMQ